MIPYSRDSKETIPASAVRIIGLGGAGANMLERITLDGVEGADLLALNTDLRTLNASIAREKIQLGVNLTKGLGAGGDPELGQQAVLEAEAQVRAAIKGRRIIFLCTGLGGGTGSGAAPIVARIAREEGAFVVIFATMPFAFEGRRRREQAETALNELAVLANALVTFDNNRMGELVLAKSGVHEAFSAADRMICESIKAVIRLVIRPGLINVGLDDLMTALRATRSRCLFGSGIADGKDRASRALANALSSPLLDKGSLLNDAQSVLVHLSGGENLTLYEIELLMQQLQKHVPEKAHVLFGAAIDPSMGDALSITLISALPEESLTSAPRKSLSGDIGAAVQATAALGPSQGFTDPPESRKEAPAAPSRPAEPAPAAAVKAPATSPEPPPKPKAAIKDEEAADQRPFAEPDVPPAPRTATFEFAEPIESPPTDPPENEPATTSTPKKNEDTKSEASPVEPPPESGFTGKSVLPPRRSNIREIKSTRPNPDGFPDNLPDPEPIEPPARKPVAQAPANPSPENPPDDDSEPDSPAPRLSLSSKLGNPQSELTFDGMPRGRFQGEDPNVVDGEDLDLPPFMRKKGG
jgi:cell division protein FtsZ